MPFKSEKQRRWMWANEPEMARRWADEEKNESHCDVHEEWDGGDNLVSPVDHAEIASGHKPHQGLEILQIAESRLREIIQEELILENGFTDLSGTWWAKEGSRLARPGETDDSQEEDSDCEDILSLYDKLEDEEQIGKYDSLSRIYDDLASAKQTLIDAFESGVDPETGALISQEELSQLERDLADFPELESSLDDKLVALEEEEEAILLDIQDIEERYGFTVEDLIQYCEDEEPYEEEWDGISEEDFVASEPSCPITTVGGGENYKLCEPYDGLTCWYTSAGAEEEAWCDAWKNIETGEKVPSQPPGPRWRKVKI